MNFTDCGPEMGGEEESQSALSPASIYCEGKVSVRGSNRNRSCWELCSWYLYKTKHSRGHSCKNAISEYKKLHFSTSLVISCSVLHLVYSIVYDLLIL